MASSFRRGGITATVEPVAGRQSVTPYLENMPPPLPAQYAYLADYKFGNPPSPTATSPSVASSGHEIPHVASQSSFATPTSPHLAVSMEHGTDLRDAQTYAFPTVCVVPQAGTSTNRPTNPPTPTPPTGTTLTVG